MKNTKNDKKRPSLKNRGLVPTIQPEPDFSWTCGFREVLDNVDLILYMKFQKIVMTGCKDMDKKIKNSLKWGFPHLLPLRFVTFVPLWCPNFM